LATAVFWYWTPQRYPLEPFLRVRKSRSLALYWWFKGEKFGDAWKMSKRAFVNWTSSKGSGKKSSPLWGQKHSNMVGFCLVEFFLLLSLYQFSKKVYSINGNQQQTQVQESPWIIHP
jgi:hypothetical protein